jgi:hypothetical protein
VPASRFLGEIATFGALSAMAERPPIGGSAYSVLGVDPGADEKTIKKHYHQIAKHWHPDVSKQADADAVFGHVVRSYTLLTNQRQRKLYDFLLANSVPNMHVPEEFLAFYNNGTYAKHVDRLFQNRHMIGWALAGGALTLVASWRASQLLRRSPAGPPPIHDEQAGHPAGAATAADAADAAVAADADNHSARPASTLAAGSSAATAAVGGLLGGAGGAGFGIAGGLSGAVGARWTFAMALAGVVAGRFALPVVEARAVVGGRLRALRSHAAHQLVAYSRPLCEVAAAATAVLLLRRAHPATNAIELHIRTLKASLAGGVGGHGVARFACREPEVQAARRELELDSSS